MLCFSQILAVQIIMSKKIYLFQSRKKEEKKVNIAILIKQNESFYTISWTHV